MLGKGAVAVAPDALSWVRVVRDEAPATHVVGWFVGPDSSQAPTSVLTALGCSQYSHAVPSSDRTAVSQPNCAHERAELDALLPVGLAVIGCYVVHDTDPETLLAALGKLVTEFGVQSSGNFLVASLAQRDVFTSQDPLSALVWQWADGKAARVTVDSAATKQFRTSTVMVSLHVSCARGESIDMGDVLFAIGGRSIEASSKALISTLDPSNSAVVDVEWGLDVSRAVSVLRRHHALAENGPLIVKSKSASEPDMQLVQVSVCGYFGPRETLGSALKRLCARADHVEWVWRTHHSSQKSAALFFPPTLPFCVCVFEGDANARRTVARRIGQPPDRALFLPRNRVERCWIPAPTKLLNVHAEMASNHGIRGGRVSLVWGHYEYCHYQQDGANDDGWGCAYRSLQTLCSWVRLQGGVSGDRKEPDARGWHAAVQRTLVAMGDKEASFVGSRQWIGAVEVSMLLGEWFGLECRTLHVPTGGGVPAIAPQLAQHFRDEGSPIMIGGGVLAWTLLGVCEGERPEDTRFLILDPHFTGADQRRTIIKGGWVAWKPPSVFRGDCFYNFCCPLIPRDQ